VLFEGAEHQVVALAGTSVRLLSDAGQDTVVALPFLLAAPDFAVFRVRSIRSCSASGYRRNQRGLLAGPGVSFLKRRIVKPADVLQARGERGLQFPDGPEPET
jgi:hypothetical protein